MKSIRRNEEKSRQTPADTCRKSLLTAANGVLLLRAAGCERGRDGDAVTVAVTLTWRTTRKHQNTRETEAPRRAPCRAAPGVTTAAGLRCHRSPQQQQHRRRARRPGAQLSANKRETNAKRNADTALANSHLPEQWLHICSPRRRRQTYGKWCLIYPEWHCFMTDRSLGQWERTFGAPATNQVVREELVESEP
ncbi:hypothetical protein Q5P01_011742 [Channa striata]|uniref:Uncharacterized protein n=1 Tax=Channa striata TaxID=64152 RepID=A0AA88STP4_CHASR|nr:hypothetical protein Q5P01_011742 [Channa striata]